MLSKPKLWAVIGATGTGKTALSLTLARQLAELGRAPEVVNADAMQLYRGMNIGTAKLPEGDRYGIPHHLFDELEPREEASVAWYQRLARQRIKEIHARGKDAILVGGSGLYVSSVLFEFEFPPRDAALREAIENQLESAGIDPLIEELTRLDNEAANAIDRNNPRRVVRALEVARLGGKAQVTLPSKPDLWYTTTQIVGTRVERGELVQRLDQRVLDMWAEGLVEEVRSLISRGIEQGKTASRAIGYAQALAQLHGEQTESEAIEETQLLTRRYARRQVSWFRRYANVTWYESETAAAEFVQQIQAPGL